MQHVMPPVTRLRPRIIRQRITHPEAVDRHPHSLAMRPRLRPQRHLQAPWEPLTGREIIIEQAMHRVPPSLCYADHE